LQFARRDDIPISYRQLLHGANAYAQLYAEAGLQPGEIIILILQHGADLIYAFFGAVLHGSVPAIMPFLTEINCY
jgi:acyl-CoA synthetase (AMP-forming)/AMP-acid ligase II